MKGNERLEKFLELQDKNIEIENIATELKITVKTLKAFLNKRGYKLDDGKYKIKESEDIKQIQFIDEKKEVKKSKKTKAEEKESTPDKKIKKTSKKEVKETNKAPKRTSKKEIKEVVSKATKKSEEKTKNKVTKPKKDRKINITQEDLDMLCEVYDWYLEVKDYKCMKPKSKPSVKDVNIEQIKSKEFKNTSVKIDKDVWDDFERLCSNSKYSKQEIITQALKDFMKEYKQLL